MDENPEKTTEVPTGTPTPEARDDAAVSVSKPGEAKAPEAPEGRTEVPAEIPILTVRNTVGFPGTIMPLNVGREKSKRVVDHALRSNKFVGILAQRKAETDDPKPDELYRVGTVCVVLKLLNMPDGTQSIIVHGVVRFVIESFVAEEPFLRARIRTWYDETVASPELDALTHNVRQTAAKVIQLLPNVPDEATVVLNNIDAPGGLADFLAANLSIDAAAKQDLLETFDVPERLRKISKALASQLQVLELSQKIQEQVKGQIDKHQREYYLQEQLKAIQQELGQGDGRSAEIEELRQRVKAAKMPEAVEKEANREIDRMTKIPQVSPEYSVTMDYVSWLCELPWAVSTTDSLDIEKAERILNADHYDLQKVKKRILEFLAVRKLKPEGRGPILCFAGPPGVGKTSLGQSIARALGRKFIRISLGGIRDEADIRGHRRTYIGALPGRIIQSLRKAGSNNPVFMLDEVDKIGQDFRGDPSSALLEVLDPAQNNSFTDHYLDVPFDLSRVMFIATANYMDPIPPPLRDRMEMLELPGYTADEKLKIAKRYLMPRQLSEHGLTADRLTLRDAALRAIIADYTREAGVRELEREIGAICRAVAAKIARGTGRGAAITPRSLPNYLGPARYLGETAQRTSVPGVVTGLAFTPTGGDILFVEATRMPGKGNLMLTGQIGDVMKESAQAAYSLVRSRTKELKLAADGFAKHDIHIHVPAGAIPKDGPSAGVSMFTALVSLLTQRPCRADVAMTGEITLRGLVLPIGGVKEKVLAAHRAGIRTVILPERNRKDLVDIPKDVRDRMHFVFAERVDQVLQNALEKARAKTVGKGATNHRPRTKATRKRSAIRNTAKRPARGKQAVAGRRKRG
jgi:ATP-dependent Lon protease